MALAVPNGGHLPLRTVVAAVAAIVLLAPAALALPIHSTSQHKSETREDVTHISNVDLPELSKERSASGGVEQPTGVDSDVRVHSWLEREKYSAVNDRRTTVIGRDRDQTVVTVHSSPSGFTRVTSVCSTCAPAAEGGGLRVTNADLDGGGAATTIEACADACTGHSACVSFTWVAANRSCSLHKYGEQYTLVPAAGCE